MTPTQQERRIQALYDDANVSRRNLCERVVHLEADMEDVAALLRDVMAMPQAATLMMKAADTIWELRCKLSGTFDERERMFRANVEKNCDLMRLMDENAKMRKLLADAWGYINHPANTTWTHKKRKEVRDSIGDRMRELGIEVD